jgi:hypothetical protein
MHIKYKAVISIENVVLRSYRTIITQIQQIEAIMTKKKFQILWNKY